jgi:hypothetical protein
MKKPTIHGNYIYQTECLSAIASKSRKSTIPREENWWKNLIILHSIFLA